MSSFGPNEVDVAQTQSRITDLQRQSQRLAADRHPLAPLDRAYCLRAIHDLSRDIARSKA